MFLKKGLESSDEKGARFRVIAMAFFLQGLTGLGQTREVFVKKYLDHNIDTIMYFLY